jgi:hypothetical protein
VEAAQVLEIVLKGINMELHRGELAAVARTVDPTSHHCFLALWERWTRSQER